MREVSLRVPRFRFRTVKLQNDQAPAPPVRVPARRPVPLAALRPRVFRSHALLREAPPLGAGMHAAMRVKMPPVRVLVTDLAKERQHEFAKTANAAHSSSARSSEIMNGASTTRDSRVPRKMPYQTRPESIRIVATITSKMPHSAASSRA